MSVALWALLLGGLLITMVLTASRLAARPVSAAMIYLFAGFALGPAGAGLVALDPIDHAPLLQNLAEVALLVSLFTVGLRMGSVPLGNWRWVLPVRLAFLSMAVTVALIASVAHAGLGLPLGAAVLMGGILAPTDPVLASDLQTEGGTSPGMLRFSLAGEGGLNDGTAFPFVVLGLGLMGLHDLGQGGWRWWVVDLAWSSGGGLVAGTLVGTAIGRTVVHLRTRHQWALGREEFLSVGVMAVAYGTAQVAWASGFLAVFAAGLALQRVRERPRRGTVPLGATTGAAGHDYATRASHSHHASAVMSGSVQDFNEQLEKLSELALVMVVGALLSTVAVWWPLAWFVPLLLLVLRPLAVLVSMPDARFRTGERLMVSWFGIRGIGSLFYLAFALNHGVPEETGRLLAAATLVTIATSIVAHGMTAQSFIRRYRAYRAAPAS